MTTSPNRIEFITRVRRLAAAFIQATDTFANLSAEMTYSNYDEAPELGGLTADDFVGINADLTPEQVLLFFQTMAALLGPLTVEQKKVFYALKASAQHIAPPPMPM